MRNPLSEKLAALPARIPTVCGLILVKFDRGAAHPLLLQEGSLDYARAVVCAVVVKVKVYPILTVEDALDVATFDLI